MRVCKIFINSSTLILSARIKIDFYCWDREDIKSYSSGICIFGVVFPFSKRLSIYFRDCSCLGIRSTAANFVCFIIPFCTF